MVAGMVNAPSAFSSHRVITTASPLISYLKFWLTDTMSAGLVSAVGSPAAGDGGDP